MSRSLRKGLITFLLATFLSCAIGLSVLWIRPVSAATVDKWDGNLIHAGWGSEEDKVKPEGYVEVYAEEPSYSDGDLTEEDLEIVEIKIQSAAALAYFAHEVYADSEHKLDGVTVTLETDIDLNNQMWIPIGQVSSAVAPEIRFSGTFDAGIKDENGEVIGNHVIYNLDATEYFKKLKYDDEMNYFIEYGQIKIPFSANGGKYSYGLFGVAGDIIVKNLTVEGINISVREVTPAGAPEKIVPDGIGTIIGYGTGDVILDGCVAGSPKTKDKITVVSKTDGAIGGIAGKIYAYGSDTRFDNYKEINIEYCVNYVDTDYTGSAAEVGGIVGSVQYFRVCAIANSVNYGNLLGGQHVGGITGQWTNPNENIPGSTDDDSSDLPDVPFNPDDPENPFDRDSYKFAISNCDNYGNIETDSSLGGSDRSTGGIIGRLYGAEANSQPAEDRCYMTVTLEGCNNYGSIVSGADGTYVGGIIGWYRNTAGITASISKNYNYGSIYSDGCKYAGGYVAHIESVGCLTDIEYADGEVIKVNQSGNLTLTGGNFGTVYGTAENIDSLFGKYNLEFSGVDGDILVERCADGGAFVSKTSDELKKMPKDNLTFEHERYTYQADEGIFKYADDDFTILLGFSDNAFVDGAEVPATLQIPDKVRKIGHAAFAGYIEITKIIFGSGLREIGDAAFAGTGLTELELPSSLLKIGVSSFAGTNITALTIPSSLVEIGYSAFANCVSLNNVKLSGNAEDITLDKNVFGGTRGGAGAYVIATGNEQYRQLVTLGKFDDSCGILTYEVTINYIYDGNKVGTELKLRGQDYRVSLKDGVWSLNSEISKVGPNAPAGTTYVWYDSMERLNNISSVENAGALLANVRADSITLYAFVSAGGKVFIARNDLVYDIRDFYSIDEINSLLYSTSDLIDFATMNVTVKYKGETVTRICDAGDYIVQVEDKAKTYKCEFTIHIERAILDLAELDNLEWFITSIGEESVKYQLESDILYIYTYSEKSDKSGQVYPSAEQLTDAQIQYLKLNNSYTTREVMYSVVLNRGKDVKVEIAGDGYSVTYAKEGGVATNIGNGVKVYTTKATITSDGNYKFVVGNIDKLRGLEIELTGETTANISKDWYLVDEGNCFLTDGKPYNVSDHEFANGGNRLQVPVPQLRFSDANNNDVISMYLYLNGSDKPIGEKSFGVSEFSQYINRVMPVGNYTLKIEVKGVLDENGIYHNAYSESYNFTVGKANLSLSREIAELQGRTFSADVKSDEIYDSTAQAAVEKILNTAIVSRDGTIWKNYENLYGKFVVEYNLLRDHSDAYSAKIVADEADTYTVYYRISAPNYYSSIENLEKGDRYDYYFTLKKYDVLEQPKVIDEGLEYTGTRLLPTIEENALYAAVWDEKDEYIVGGKHTVWFELYDKDHYRWKDADGKILVDDKGNPVFLVPVEFEIGQATNDFTVSLNILGWSFEAFNAATNSIRANVRFLDSGESIHFSVSKKDAGTSVEGLGDFSIDKDGKVGADIEAILNKLDAGDYVLYANVKGTGNYKELKDNVPFVVSKAMNSWADGEDDLVIPSWIVGKYNPEENAIVVNAEHGTVNILVTDLDGTKEYYNSSTGLNILDECEVGKYMLRVWVVSSDNYGGLAERNFIIQVFEKAGLPWWVTLLVVVGALGLAALIIFILWKKGVFKVVTDKILVAIRTRVSVEATIASVRAAKMMEEGRKSIEDAKRRERLEKLHQKQREQREMSPEERAALLEAKAQADAERAEKLRARSEEGHKKAAKMRNQEASKNTEAPEQSETPTEE